MNTLQSAEGARKSRKRVGRGQSSGRGKTAGRGTKGQRARSGGKKGLKLKGMRQNLLTFPKLRGFKSEKGPTATVRLEALDAFGAGSIVSMKSLRQKGLVKRSDRFAKIVDGGELNKKLIIEDIPVSKSAKEKIEKVGGEIKTSKKQSGSKKKTEAKKANRK